MAPGVRKKWCVAPNCIFSRDADEKPKIDESTHFHHFPADATRRQSWVNATPIRNFSVSQVVDETYLWHLHFSVSSYVDQRQSRGSELRRSQLKKRCSAKHLAKLPGVLVQREPLASSYVFRHCMPVNLLGILTGAFAFR